MLPCVALSLPLRERELKPNTRCSGELTKASLPLRERELKLSRVGERRGALKVAPFTGA